MAQLQVSSLYDRFRFSCFWGNDLPGLPVYKQGLNLGKFFIALFFSAILLAGGTLTGVAEGIFPEPSFFLQTLIFLVFSTGLLFVYLFKANKPDFFLQLYLLSMTVKLLAYCVYCLIVILDDRDGAVSNMVFFMACYFIFTALEIGFLYHKINRQK
jgi:hypothetical protein